MRFAASCFAFAEVTDINKQRFLVELSRLLTFMSEEDRQEALTLYEKMFDDTDDEQGLLQALVSPTRQAVIIARAYDANARKLQAYAKAQRKTAAHEAPEATPDFVLAILQVYEQAVPLPVEPKAPVPVPAPAEEEPELNTVDPDQLSLFEDDDQSGEADETAPPADGEEADDVQAADVSSSDLLDEVDVFLSSFSIADDDLSASGEESRSLPPQEDTPDAGEPLPVPDEKEETPSGERRARPFLLILFILIAVPLTLAVTLVLLVPTLLSLVLAAVSIVGGCAVAVAAFSGFPVFADILIVLGCAIILLALGLLFLWLFIWFVGAVIGGLIRWVIQLGGKWCYKEVAA